MKPKNSKIIEEDLYALSKITKQIENFLNKNIIYYNEKKIQRVKKRLAKVYKEKDYQQRLTLFEEIISSLKLIILKEVKSKIYYLVGGHGGIIIDDIGFCEFDSPSYGTSKLVKRMELSIENNIPYNLEIAICCLEWIQNNFPTQFSEFLKLYKKGKFEIINPTYSQPYNLIIGAESNIKQFE
ncbi:MAG: hypothetical protein EU548_02280, partial [Promethearchaeota archaeon]